MSDGQADEPVSETHLMVKDSRCWIPDLSAKYRLDVAIIGHKAHGHNMARDVIDVLHPYVGRDLVVAAIKTRPTVVNFRMIHSGASQFLAVVDSKGCSACNALDESACLATEMFARPRSGMEWAITSVSLAEVRQLLQMLGERGCYAEVRRVHSGWERSDITPRQLQILTAAKELGYFDTPRRSNLEDIAVRFGVSKATVGETLRRALRGVLRRFA